MSRGKTLLILPILLAIAGYLYWQHYTKTFGNQGRLVIAQEGNAIVLFWHSEVAVPMVKRFSEAFGEWRDKTDTFVIDLNSPGGALREGGRVIDMINTMKATHNIVTRVTARNYCLSMCVPIYLAGERRIASSSSVWMFHEPQARDFFTGEDVETLEFEKQYHSNRFFEKYLANSEMNPAWAENLKLEWVGREVWKTGQQLFDEKSNIILKLE